MSYKNPAEQRAYQNGYISAARKFWFEEHGPCVKCGSWDALELDHIDPADKVTHRIWTYSAEKRRAELAKCQVLCKVCHQEKTTAQLSKPLVHGTINGYAKHKCKCEDCRKANRDRCYKRLARLKQQAEQIAPGRLERPTSAL